MREARCSSKGNIPREVMSSWKPPRALLSSNITFVSSRAAVEVMAAVGTDHLAPNTHTHPAAPGHTRVPSPAAAAASCAQPHLKFIVKETNSQILPSIN